MITVIVPAYNEEKTIKTCLDSIRTKFYTDYEIIVVAGGDDKTLEIAKQYGIAVPDEKNKGAGPARNQGAKLAKGEVLVFTDADTIVNPHWLEKYAKVFEHQELVASGGPVRPLNGSLLDKLAFKLNQDWGYRITAFFGVFQFSGQNCAYRKDAFFEAGGFNEDMSMLEDTELSSRMKEYGKCVHIKDNWVVSSPRRFHQNGYLRTLWKFVRNYFKLIILRKPPKEAYFASADK